MQIWTYHRGTKDRSRSGAPPMASRRKEKKDMLTITALNILRRSAQEYRDQKETTDIIIAAERLHATVETIVKMLDGETPSITLTPADQQKLENMIMVTSSPMAPEDFENVVLKKRDKEQALREKITKLHKAGKTIPQIAREAGTTQKKVQEQLNFERSMNAK